MTNNAIAQYCDPPEEDLVYESIYVPITFEQCDDQVTMRVGVRGSFVNDQHFVHIYFDKDQDGTTYETDYYLGTVTIVDPVDTSWFEITVSDFTVFATYNYRAVMTFDGDATGPCDVVPAFTSYGRHFGDIEDGQFTYQDLNPISASSDNASICVPSSAVVNAYPSGGTGTYTHQWQITGGTATGVVLSNANSASVIVDASLATAGSVDLQYTVTDDQSCTAQSTSLINISVEPNISAGSDFDHCLSNPMIPLSGAITGTVSTGTWSGGAGTFNPDASTLNAAYTPSAAEILSGSVTLTLTSDDPAGPCSAVSDDITITFSAPTIVNAGTDIVNCTGAPQILDGSIGGGASSATWSGGAGSFSPNPNTLNAIYTPTSTEIQSGSLTLTLTTNSPVGACAAESDNVTITFGTPVIFSAIPTLCSDDLPITLAATPGGGVFTGPGVSGNSFNPATAGPGNHLLTYTYTDANSCVISENQTAVVNAAPCASSCTTIQFDDFDSSFGNWNDGGGDAERVNNNGSNNSPSIRLRDNSGAASSMTTSPLDLSSYNEVQIGFHFETNSFENNEDFFLEISLNGGSSFSTIQEWNAGSEFVNNQEYDETVLVTGFTLSANTVFRFRADASNNGDELFIDDVLITGEIDIQFDQPADLCESDATITLSATPIGGFFTGPGVIGSTFDPGIAGSGNHTITYNYLNGSCIVTEDVVIVVNPSPCPVNNCNTIQFDDYDSSLGNWIEGGGDAARVNDNGSNNSPSIRLRDNSGAASSMSTYLLDLSGYNEVQIGFHFETNSFEDNEDFFLEISLDGGSNFTLIQEWNSGSEFVNNQEYDETVLVTGITFTSNTVFRFRADASNDGDELYIDDVLITGDIDIQINPLANFCESDDPISLSATPPGGSFSGSGVVGSTFDPSIAGPGNHTITYTYSNGTCIVTEDIVTTVDPGPCPTIVCDTIFFDDYEIGFGNWIDGGGDAASVNNNGTNGSASIRLRDNSGSASSMWTPSFDASNNISISVNFSYYVNSFESNEDFFLEISTDGGANYTLIEDWVSGTDFNNNQRYSESIEISGISFTSDTRLRFRSDASNNGDEVFIDDVLVTGCYEETCSNVSFVNGTTLSNDEGLLAPSITVHLSIPTARSSDLDISYYTIDQSASAGQDYTAVVNGIATIVAGQTSTVVGGTPIQVNITDDAIYETDELFEIVIASSSSVCVDPDSILNVTIVNDDNSAPILTNIENDNMLYCPGGSQDSIITNTIIVSDPENDNLTASVTLSGITDPAADQLNVDLSGYPLATASYSYPTLSISGTITPTEMQDILRSVEFSTSSSTMGVRSVLVVVNDGINNSNILTRNINSNESDAACCNASAPSIGK